MADKKILIAYFSRKGENYVGGSIVNLPVGNTEVIARKIQALTYGDLFHIETITPYHTDYTATTNIAQRELRTDARPELTAQVLGMEDYDIVFLGYPNWWGTMPMAVYTFLESYDFARKIIAPFCTHEGSGMGQSESDIRRLCPESKVLKDLPIRGGSAARADGEVKNWVKAIIQTM